MKDKNILLEKDLLLEILENITSAVYVMNQDERIIYVNRAAEKLDNYTRAEVLGRPLTEVYKDIVFTEEKDSPCLIALRTGQLCQDENLEWFSHGKVVNTLTSTYLVTEGNQVQAVYAVCDDLDSMKHRVIRNSQFGRQMIYKTHTKRLKNGTKYVFDDIIGNSAPLKNAVSTAKRFAAKQMPVMLYGETGTGKEMFAQSIHNASERYAGPFVAVNCAAIPDNLLESILFGTKKGAFTGAIDNVGMFERAENGTLFLDEINSLPIHLQSKLLRSLQEKEIQRIGETKVRRINCRIISATNESPDQLLSEGKMREDLYYRLSTGVVFIPPLRERGRDLDVLILRIIQELNSELNTVIIGLTPALNGMLHQYSWPGNVRELTNVLASAFNFISERDGYVGVEHLPSYIRAKIEEWISYMPLDIVAPVRKTGEGEELVIDQNINHMVDQYERRLIERAMEEMGGKLTRCSEKLGISRQALSVKLKKYGIRASEYKK